MSREQGARQGRKRRSEARSRRETDGLRTRRSVGSGGPFDPGAFWFGAPAVVVTPLTKSVRKRLPQKVRL